LKLVNEISLVPFVDTTWSI